MKNKVKVMFVTIIVLTILIALSGCGIRESERVSYNISKQKPETLFCLRHHSKLSK